MQMILIVCILTLIHKNIHIGYKNKGRLQNNLNE